MLVVCLGTPSFLAYGIDAILSEIFRYFYNCDFSHVYAITFAQLRTQFETLGNNDKNVKIFSDLPSYELSKVTISTKAPILFAQDDFETLVLTLIAERKMDFTASTRMATQSFALLACGDDVNNAVHYGGNSYHLRLDAIIDQILEFCRFQATDEDRNIVLERLQGPLNSDNQTLRDIIAFRFPSFEEVPVAKNLLSETQKEILASLSRSYDALLGQNDLATVDWPLAVFQRQDNMTQAPIGPLELVGPARCLAFGPYLHLPRGYWKVRVQLMVEGSLSDNKIILEVFSLVTLNHARMTLPPDGAFECDLDFFVKDPFYPIEIRIFLATGAIEGEILLLKIQCEPVNSAPVAKS